MRRLRGRGLRALRLVAAVIVVAGAGLAVLVLTAEPVPAAHAQAGGGAEQGMIVVADRGNDRLQMFYPDGTFALKFKHVGGVYDIGSIDVGPDGRIIMAKRYDGVHAFHPNGSYASRVVSAGSGVGLLGGDSVSAAVAPDGRIVVADHGDRIQVFESDGLLVLAFGVDVRSSRVLHDVDVAPDGRIVAVSSYGHGSCGSVSPGVHILHPNGTPAVPSWLVMDQSFNPGCYHDFDVVVAPDGRIVLTYDDRQDYSYLESTVGVLRPLSNGTFVSDFVIEAGGGGYRSLAVAPDGRIVAGARNNTIQVYHPNGSLALSFGGSGGPQGGFDRPTDVAVGPDGRIVVAEPGNLTISVFHPNGTPAFAFGGRGHGDDAFYEPRQVAVAPDGRIVVADTGKRRILVFEPDGMPAFAFGAGGIGAGQFYDINDVAVGPDGRVVVSDDWRGIFGPTGRVQVFSPDGETVSELVSGFIWQNVKVAVAPDGRIVVGNAVDDWAVSRVGVFEPNGTEAFVIQVNPAIGVSGVAVAPDGRIVVVQDSRSQVFNPDGSFVFATEIDVVAVSVAVGPSREIVVVDDHDDRVQVFNPNGTFAFSLLPDLSEGKFNRIGPIAVGPLMPPSRGDPEPLWTSIGPEEGGGGGGPILRNFTGAGDAANVTIDVGGLAEGPGGADALNGSASSTVSFPSIETVVAASFAEVTFPPNVTASHVPAGGLLGLRIATAVPTAEQVQAALGRGANGTGPELVVLLQSVVEVGGDQSRIAFDLPVRIALEGQAGGLAFYIEGPNDTIVPIDEACAADDVDSVHQQLGGVGECQMDAVNGTAKIVYTYHLTKFGTVSTEGPVPVRTDAVDPPAHPPPVVVVVPPVNGTFGGGGGGGGNVTNGTAGPPTPQPVVPPTPQPQQPPGGDGGRPVVVPPPVVVVPPTRAVDMCGVTIDFPALDMSARPGEYSEPVEQVVRNAGTLPLARVEIVATPWHDGSGPPTTPPLPGVPPPYSGPTQGRTAGAFTAYMIASLPASVTEVREGLRVEGRQVTGGGAYVPLVDDGRGTAVLEGLEPGAWAPLSFRLNLTSYDGLLAGALVQSVDYQVECAPPSTSPAP